MRRFFSRRRKSIVQSSKRNRRRLKAACLSLGLATAWGGEAAADVTFKVEIAPQQTLTNAVVFYGNNASTGVLRSLGTVQGGQTTTFVHSLLTNGVRTGVEGNWTWKPSSYVSGLGNKPPFYAVIGVSEGESGPSVSVSFPTDAPIVDLATWSSIFERTAGVRYAKEDVIDELLHVQFHPEYPQVVVSDTLRGFFLWYLDVEGRGLDRPIATSYGKSATLVNFSGATFGGTVIAVLVPEPATWFLLVSAAGIMLVQRRRDGVR